MLSYHTYTNKHMQAHRAVSRQLWPDAEPSKLLLQLEGLVNDATLLQLTSAAGVNSIEALQKPTVTAAGAF